MIKVKNSVTQFKILKINNLESTNEVDLIVSEEPLQIKLQFFQNGEWAEKPLSITMRTPGGDFELAQGFLFNEGVVRSQNEILQIRYCETAKQEEKGNVVIVKLSPD